MKETIHNIELPITHIVNRSFNTGIFQDILKIAKLIPIYKTLNKWELKSYRPITE